MSANLGNDIAAFLDALPLEDGWTASIQIHRTSTGWICWCGGHSAECPTVDQAFAAVIASVTAAGGKLWMHEQAGEAVSP